MFTLPDQNLSWTVNRLAGRTLAGLLCVAICAPIGSATNGAEQAPNSSAVQPAASPTNVQSASNVDETKISPAGIRKLSGKHITLYTDLSPQPSVDELPAVFDQAVALWQEFLGLDKAECERFHIRGAVMRDRERFKTAGLLPPSVPDFQNGWTGKGEFWINDQSSEYYRRHLMLHEGTHGIMFAVQKSQGPPWYMEGVAELLATHRWKDGKLAVGVFPSDAAEVPKLGRIEIVQTEFARNRALKLRDVLAYDNRAHLQNEPYAWSWAAVAFFHEHPRYRERFSRLLKQPARQDFNAQMRTIFENDRQALAEEWQIFVANLVHGYDFERMAIDLNTEAAPIQGNAEFDVAANRGWQNTRLLVEKGRRYRIAGEGEFLLGTKPQPWVSQANGITLRYHHGLPLGVLLAGIRGTTATPEIRPNGGPPQETENKHQAEPSDRVTLINPAVIGTAATFVAPRTGVLYLRVNDSAGGLADNSGTLAVRVFEQPN